MGSDFYIKNGLVVDPVEGTAERRDLFVLDGVIVSPPKVISDEVEVIDAEGLIVVPPFIDIHVHFREPGGEAAETIASGCRAAVAAGFGTVVTMPNTLPPTDTPELVRKQIEAGRQQGGVKVWPSACITRGRGGVELTDMAALAGAGAVCFTDDGSTVMDDALMRGAMEVAAGLGLPIMDHAQRSGDEKRGVMHESAMSAELGLPGIPVEAEAEIVERDIRLAAETGCALHIQHVSAAASVELIRAAKADGIKVTAEVTPHHIALCDRDVRVDDANFKMNPPLRSLVDQTALRHAVRDGVIDCFATDHAPHVSMHKERGFRRAPFGVLGLETAIGVTYTELVAMGEISLLDWVRCWTVKPMAVLGRGYTSLNEGERGDVMLLDVDTHWFVDSEEFRSLSKNTCFEGRELRGSAVRIFLRDEGILS